MTREPACSGATGKRLSVCYAPFIEGTAAPETAESLMRSRSIASSLGGKDYLQATRHPATRTRNPGLDESVKWIGPEVVRDWDGGPEDGDGKVELIARHKVSGRAPRLHEVSRFVHGDGHWFYLDGETRQ